MVFVQGPYSFYSAAGSSGVCRGGIFPGVIYYLVCWFPGAYRARMMALFTAGIPLSSRDRRPDIQQLV